MLAPYVAQYPVAVALANLNQPGERVECGRNVPRLLGRHDDAIVLMIIGKCRSEAVKYAPALRRQELQIDAVLVRKHCVTVRLQDLQLVHSLGKSGEEDCLAGAKDRRPPVQELMSLGLTLHRRRG
jgi:hypothetical protein